MPSSLSNDFLKNDLFSSPTFFGWGLGDLPYIIINWRKVYR
jgi:hypothetical protein